MNNTDGKNERLAKNINTFLKILLMLTGFVIVATPAYMMPKVGLDESWMWGLNEALALGMKFGRDVVFSFGPYLGLFTQRYHPAVDAFSVISHVYLGLCYAVALAVSTRKSPSVLIICMIALVAGGIQTRDTLIVLYPLLFGASVVTILSDREDSKLNTADYFSIAVMVTALGMLPLIKGSYLISATIISALTFTLLFYKNMRLLAILSIVVPLISMAFFWILAGQDIFELFNYFSNLSSVVSGYSEAMQLPGDLLQIFLYIAVSGTILLSSVLWTNSSLPYRAYIFLFIGAYLFLLFKESFVRHDAWHAVTAGEAVLAAAVGLAVIQRSIASYLILPCALVAALVINGMSGEPLSDFAYKNSAKNFENAFKGAFRRIFTPNALPELYATRLQTVKTELSLPKLSGTSDIYSYGQAYLLASGDTWAPRPVIQGYSAYTPALQQLNLDHLLGKSAPDNIFFKVETIDDRLPSLEDGMSWPSIMANYAAWDFQRDYLYMRKRAEPRQAQQSHISTFNFLIGVDYSVPHSGASVYSRIRFKQSLVGKLVQFLYKPSQLRLTLQLADGTSRNFRISSGLAASGFLLSPLIENTGELALLMVDPGYIGSKEVKSFRVDASSIGRHIWSPNFTIDFSTFDATDTIASAKQVKEAIFAPFLTELELPAQAGAATSVTCQGSIDAINGISPSPIPVPAGRTLSIKGWNAISGSEGRISSELLVKLTDDHGSTLFASTQAEDREDIAAYFKRPELRASGFKAFIDTSNFIGHVRISVARVNENRLEICENLQSDLVLGGGTH